MKHRLLILSLTLALAACGGENTNPFATNQAAANGEDTTSTSDATTNTGDPLSTDRTILPGTVNPTNSDTIFRREARSDSESGAGFAEDFRYDGATDTFFVDNLAFDGEGGYTAVRDGTGQRLGIGPFNVYENSAVAVDGLTTANINQLVYRALYGNSPDGSTSVAIIRTAGYTDYGFGGFIYQRNGGVVLPESGQARYTGTGNYGGLRDFKGKGGLEYVSGDMEVRIDFNDFNEGAGVIGVVSNRRVFDLSGNDITNDILTAFGGAVTQMPRLLFDIEPGVLDSNGELTGTLQSTNPITGNAFESGTYYGVLAGATAGTISGIVVVTGEDPRDSNITFRETGGFIATRQ